MKKFEARFHQFNWRRLYAAATGLILTLSGAVRGYGGIEGALLELSLSAQPSEFEITQVRILEEPQAVLGPVRDM